MIAPTAHNLPSPLVGNNFPTTPFYSFVKNAIPLDVALPVEELRSLLKQEYPYYVKSLVKRDEAFLVVSSETFNAKLDRVFNLIKEGDLINEPDLGNPLYVFDLDGSLYTKPLTGDYSKALPREAVKMFKQYNVKYEEDLPDIYRHASVNFIEYVPGKLLEIAEKWYGNIVEVTMDGHGFFVKESSVRYYPPEDKQKLNIRERPPPPRTASPVRQRAQSPTRATQQVPAMPARTTPNYAAMKVAELRELARQKGLRGITALTKGDLIARLEAADGR